MRMNSSYKPIYQLVAQLLLVIFLLESCYNNNTLVQLRPEKETNTQQLIGKKKVLTPKRKIRKDDYQLASLLLKQHMCLAKGAHQITFKKKSESKELEAVVQECFPDGLSRSYLLPVVIEPGFIASEQALKPLPAKAGRLGKACKAEVKG